MLNSIALHLVFHPRSGTANLQDMHNSIAYRVGFTSALRRASNGSSGACLVDWEDCGHE
jgi:hypothetical protein